MLNFSLKGLVVAALMLVVLFTGCSGFGLVTGQGEITSKSYSFNDFTAIEVGSAFEVEIKPSETYGVTVTTYENLFNYLDISHVDRTLKIKLKSGRYTNARPRATVSLPVLARLTLSGASRGIARGFSSKPDLDIIVSGASSLEIDCQSVNVDLNLSGASKLDGHLQGTHLKMDISSASRVDLNGSADSLSLNVSGASQVNLTGLSSQIAEVNLSGASRGNIAVNNKLDIDLSGASSLTYSGKPTLGIVSITGASSLNPPK